MQDVATCPARKPPAAKDRPQVPRAYPAQRWTAAREILGCCKHFPSRPRVGDGRFVAIGSGLVLARAGARVPGFLAEARGVRVSWTSDRSDTSVTGCRRTQSTYSAARLPAPAGTSPYRTPVRMSGVLPVSTTPNRPASRSKRRYFATVDRRIPARRLTRLHVGRVVRDVQSADRASTHATDIRFVCASTRSVAKAGCASTARIHAAWPGARLEPSGIASAHARCRAEGPRAGLVGARECARERCGAPASRTSGVSSGHVGLARGQGDIVVSGSAFAVLSAHWPGNLGAEVRGDVRLFV